MKPLDTGKPTPEAADPAIRVNQANAAARVQPVRNGFINAVQIYPYSAGALYQAYTAPGEITDIALQEGEQLAGTGSLAMYCSLACKVSSKPIVPHCIRITPAGETLLSATGGALSLLKDACADIRGTRLRLTVSAHTSFSAMWLARRLADFSALHPETPLNAIIQDSEPDFARHSIDLAIVHVRESALRSDDMVLLREEVFPVCSPDLYASASKALRRCRLLQEEDGGNPEIDWRSWAPAFDLPDDFETKLVRYATFVQVVGAAVGGAGVALGRSPLIDPELASGRLVRVYSDVSRAASWRFVLRRGPGRRHRMLQPLMDFLRAEAASDSGPSDRPK